MTYAELQAASAFSFLRGASRAEELAATAAVLGIQALGIADRNTVAGVVRAHDAARQVGLRLLPGARLVFRDGTPDLLCYPTDRIAWGRLTKLLTQGKGRALHGDGSEIARATNRCLLDYADLLEHGAGQALLVVPPHHLGAGFQKAIDRIAADFPTAGIAASRRYRADDARRLRALDRMKLPMLATNDVLYHAAERRPLQDALTAIRLGCRVDAAGLALEPNGERHLKSPREMARLFHGYPHALARTSEFAARCRFSLDELTYEYPDEPVPPGTTADAHLAALTWQGAAERYPDGISDKLRKTLAAELRLIGQLQYARYFLTVHDIVRYARARGILCQGRGSAANSAVCYCLGVTAVDPEQIDLLFARFISAERQEPPDIDVDFEHERREEVIQYIYQRYGRDRAGIAATIIHYRPKSAIRDIGKAMGLSDDTTALLSQQSRHATGELWPDDRLVEIGLDPASPVLRRTVDLARELVGFPRHLSQHVGGFVLTRGRLDETVPIGQAAMDQRTFIEWDKDDIDTLGIMKVDVLALGMLTCIRKALDLVGIADLADVPREDPSVYRMLSRGDSIGVFQVESRAQIAMLPRLRPKTLYDLVIEVAIVRPGPIQGDMVHPYLRRRSGQEPVVYPAPSPEHGPADELRQVLGKTLGVPLFQEQAMRLAITAAGFTPEEANQLRRAMATFRNVGTIHSFGEKLIEGMVARGYERDFAERCFRQIEGFGTYGFPESHAASFALLVYVSAWLKCHHPARFACALLNSQPMGFYAPAQLVRDAREHGAEIRAIDVIASRWDCTMENGAPGNSARGNSATENGAILRLGLRLISGFRQDWAEQIEAVQASGLHGFADLVRAGIPRTAIVALAEADALRGIGLDRRAGLWQARGLTDAPALPLFAQLPHVVRMVDLPAMPAPEQSVADYRVTGLSLKAHPLRFLRPMLARNAVRSCAEAGNLAHGTPVRVAGLVLVRQRPGNGGVVFCTLEDETGIANLVIWASLLERYRREILGSRLLLAIGRVQRSAENVIHIIAERLEDRSTLLAKLVEADFSGARSPTEFPDIYPQAASPTVSLPRSRDFH